VLRAARWLHVGGAPGFGADRAQEGRRVEGARADLHVVRLQERATLAVPVLLQAQDQLLKAEHGAVAASKNGHSSGSSATPPHRAGFVTFALARFRAFATPSGASR